ncbi:hypothetical protein CVT24_006235 [Panaeolus cyanescens]|uniref:HAMP domain-containing protein n=1 Tax=Panaeolus cyanescens TaxID=181874 RepID=A0A409YEF1_9AGAR|nr:hypothetical protein CVT24_006235 [Panaeolus cyanescens]
MPWKGLLILCNKPESTNLEQEIRSATRIVIVNLMAKNLMNQMRSIAEVTKAVADGDLMKIIEVDVLGENLELKENAMGLSDSLSLSADEVTWEAREKDLTDNVNVMDNNLTLLQLTIFAAEVKKVAREVGTGGELEVQAEGTFKEFGRSLRALSVNTMAGDLTTQVRGFAQMSAAAMDGDFTRFITAEASGEMGSLKTQINQMHAYEWYHRFRRSKLVGQAVSSSLRQTVFGILNTHSRRSCFSEFNSLDLTYDVEPDIPDQLIGDSVHLRQVVGNTIKLTPSEEGTCHALHSVVGVG